MKGALKQGFARPKAFRFLVFYNFSGQKKSKVYALLFFRKYLAKPTGPVSRVLFKAVIYLDGGLLPPLQPSFGTRRTSVSSRLMLLRIGFTGQCGLPHSGELLPRLSTLTDCSAVYLCCTFPKVTLGGR